MGGNSKTAKKKTEHALSGNASKNSEWQSRQKYLESEIEMLKAQLAKTAKAPDASKHVTPQAPPKVIANVDAHPHASPKVSKQAKGTTESKAPSQFRGSKPAEAAKLAPKVHTPE